MMSFDREIIEEKRVLKALGLSRTKFLNIITENLKISNQQPFKYNGRGSYALKEGQPFFNLSSGTILAPDKSMFIGLSSNAVQFEKPIGGDIEVTVEQHQSLEERRSSRYRDFIPIGYSSKLNWRKGHILFAWLVDRYFYKVSFNRLPAKQGYDKIEA
ncbi:MULTISPECIES: hypothetical protein [unclassified Streptococcus]|uniref:hypothetical protein n=1 Tax=unclassified Streptococcus TaxID=2608887 RepID=UPI001071B8B9|nr:MULTISPECIES: hypothetical protein [unclassified Streptococcus]MBF0805403.1 hypothetical protein [Streptococcus sp. 19428wA2_WM07]TFU29117.1 hypothetical protein E4T71_01090 [Streptococcus sp. WM07]